MRRLILFGKRPRLGRVKTRLVPPLSSEQALTLYRAFLIDQLRFVRQFRGIDPVWCADGKLDGAPDRALPLDGIRVSQQGSGDLGKRLTQALADASREGATATVIIGTDSPTLPASHVSSAFERIERGAPAVLSPALDGGYVLIGVQRPQPELFARIPWGGPEVALTTRQRAREAGIRLDEIEPWYDVDDQAGLTRLRSELAARDSSDRAADTARVLLDLPIDPVV